MRPFLMEARTTRDDDVAVIRFRDGEWARSEFPDPLVTLDFNAEGQLLAIELIGPRADAARQVGAG